MILIILSGHSFAYLMAAEMLWYVQNCGLIKSLFLRNDNMNFDYICINELINHL